MELTKELRAEYLNLYSTLQVNSNRRRLVTNIAKRILKHRDKYEQVTLATGVPFEIIGLIHNMESGGNFTRHLHNGDSLKRRTVQVPAGRPKTGTPPFTWVESAIDAIKLRKMHRVKNWDIATILFELEGYNGWGYRKYHPHVKSPYLWSFSNQYIRGKYVADGTWSETAVSKQAGVAVVLKVMHELLRKDEEDSGIDVGTVNPLVYYSTKVVPYVEELQVWLNRFPGISLRVDGKPGRYTSVAFHKVFGVYLPKDPNH